MQQDPTWPNKALSKGNPFATSAQTGVGKPKKVFAWHNQGMTRLRSSQKDGGMFRSTALWLGGFCILLLAACGGNSSHQIATPSSGSGGGGSGSGSSDGAPTVTISGKATYERVPVTATGLNYLAITTLPIRGAVVEVRNSAGSTVLYSSTTAEDGTYAVKAPFNTAVKVLVTAQLGTTTANLTKVVDNTNSNALYTLFVDKTIVGSNLTAVDFAATTGWDATSGTYAAPRTAAPFAILDTVYDARKLILSADATVKFPALSVKWSKDNSTASIKTADFSPSEGSLYLRGKEDDDTDEFDDHVIAHQWGHYFEYNFSRSDSVGGPRDNVSILDERVAFSEGWANAFSGMATANAIYADTRGLKQQTVFRMNLESDLVSDTLQVDANRKFDGAWNEFSVQQILWDCFDGPVSGVASTDTETVNLGFKPLYDIFVGAQKTTPGFTTIYSFMYHLKAANPTVAAALTGLEQAENIGQHDDFEETARRRYTTISLTDGTPQALDFNNQQLTTLATYGAIQSDYPGNKLFNWQFLKVTVPATGNSFVLKVTPLNTAADGGDVIILLGGPHAAEKNANAAGEAESIQFTTAEIPTGTVIPISVGSFKRTGVTDGVTPYSISFGTSDQVTPAPALPSTPAAPGGNG